MQRRRDRVYRLVIAAFRLLFRAFDVRFDVRGTGNIPADGPAVLACNHVGYLDFTFVGVAARRRGRLVRFMAKRSTFDNPVSGPAMRAMGHIPVDRGGPLAGAPAYRRAIRALQAGELVGVFPESTISRSWTLRPFKPGAAALAVREQVPLVPVVTWGGHRLATTDGHVEPHRHVPVSVWVGLPILPTPEGTVAEVQAALRAAIASMLDDAQRAYPVDGRGRWWQPLHLDGMAPTREQAAQIEARVEAARAQTDGVSVSSSVPSAGSASTLP